MDKTYAFRSAEVRAGGRGHFRIRPSVRSFRGQRLELRKDARPHFDIVAISVGGVV